MPIQLSRVRDHGFKDHSTSQVSITTGDASTVPTHAPQQQTAFGNVRGTYPQVSQPVRDLNFIARVRARANSDPSQISLSTYP